MSNFAIGTLVMLRAPEGILNAPLHNGMIGEVKDSSKFNAEMPVGEVAVEFPTAKSKGYTGYWKLHTKYLIPLSDPDIDVGDEDVVKKTDKTPVEAL